MMSEENTENIENTEVSQEDAVPNTENSVNDAIQSLRLSGLMGIKLGMTHSILDDGRVIPTTLVKLGPCYALEKNSKKS